MRHLVLGLPDLELLKTGQINLYILIKVQALLIQLPDVIVEIYSSW